MAFETERFLLRCREESDAENLYKYAGSPDVDRLPDGLLIRVSMKAWT